LLGSYIEKIRDESNNGFGNTLYLREKHLSHLWKEVFFFHKLQVYYTSNNNI